MAVTTTYSFFSVAPEFGVNSTVAFSQTAAGLARLANGNLAFAFQSDEVVLPNQHVLGRILTPAGAAVTADFNVQVGPGDLETVPQLAALSGGNVVVAYTDTNASGSAGGTSTAFRIFTPGGSGLGPPILVRNEADDQTAPAIAALGSGFVIVHLDQTGGSTTDNALFAQRYNADGTTNGAQISVTSTTNGSPLGAPKVVTLSDGGFVVVWAGDVTAGAGVNYNIFAQRYTSAGVANGALITVDSELDNQTNPAVAALAGGGFAVAWEDEQSGSLSNGNIDFVSVSGTGVVGSYADITRSGRQSAPSLASLAGDVFVITYASDENGTPDVFAAAANASGVLTTLAIEVGGSPQNQPAAVGLDDGAFVTAWTDGNGDGSGSRISARQDRVGRLSIGDNANDTITGDALLDTIDGGSGLDTIDGGAGDDFLQGGLDADSINGGIGNDILFGNTQANPGGSVVGDSLDGAGGNDTIQGSGGGDSVLGGSGDDLIDGGAGNDLLQGGFDADIVNGGEGNDNIFAATQVDPGGSDVGDQLAGAAGNDTITGSNGADQIFGGTGNDSLVGGGDDDTLYGDAGNDTMLGGFGEDKYVINDATDVVTELVGEGVADTAFVGINGWSSFANIEIIRLFGTANSVFGQTGSQQMVANAGIGNGSVLIAQGGDDVLWGSAFGDVLDGGGGSDTIRGGAGADQMFGGNGVDIYVVEDLGDQMIETPGGGYDTVYVTVNNYILPESGGAFAAHIEVAYLAGIAVFLNGSTSGENLVANPTAGSVLAAFGGNDILYGSDFGDSFTGGTGSDIIYSGGGADAIRFVESDWGFDQVSDFTPGAGDRLVFSAASGVTAFAQLAVIDNGVNTQVSFGTNSVLLYNYIGLNAGDVQFIA